MFANRYTALVDACSLVSVLRRNLLLSLAEAEFFRVRWSVPILTETEQALAALHAKRSLDDGEARAARAVHDMVRAFPEAMVQDFDVHSADFCRLPDTGDEHVLAAAIKTQAQAIVTENLRDFPVEILERFNIEARSADEFIADTIALEEGRAVAAIRRMRQRLKRPEMGPGAFLKILEAHGLMETASILSGHIESV